MRIWDVEPAWLCRQHLLGEHREFHAVWTVLTEDKTGYANHPETIRWRGKAKALFNRHAKLVKEMMKRGYGHHSPLDVAQAKGPDVQTVFVDSPAEQLTLLKLKGCECRTAE